jgi:hypothetical protein
MECGVGAPLTKHLLSVTALSLVTLSLATLSLVTLAAVNMANAAPNAQTELIVPSILQTSHGFITPNGYISYIKSAPINQEILEPKLYIDVLEDQGGALTNQVKISFG